MLNKIRQVDCLAVTSLEMYDATKLKEAKVLGDAVNDFFFPRETVLSAITPRFKREPESEVDLFSRLRALIQTHKSYRATSPLRY